MIARYDLYESPNPDKEKITRNLHARLITDGTIETEDLARKIEYASSLTLGDVEAVLSGLSYQIGELLSQGRRIHLKGLGYLQMTVKCPPTTNRDKVRGDQIEFKSVSFRPEKELKIKLEQTRFLRDEKFSIHSPNYTSDKLEELLADYFQEHHYITRLQFQRLGGFTKTTAISRLKQLVTEGKLRKQGSSNAPFYELIPNNGMEEAGDTNQETSMQEEIEETA